MPKQPPSFKPPHYRSKKEAAQQYDRQRGTVAERGYGSKWQRARRVYLMEYPVCVQCGYAANEVDHIIPHRGDMTLFWDTNNWQSLCKPCHSAKTASGL